MGSNQIRVGCNDAPIHHNTFVLSSGFVLIDFGRGLAAPLGEIDEAETACHRLLLPSAFLRFVEPLQTDQVLARRRVLEDVKGHIELALHREVR
mmetsp:Transcript_42003/g.55339  ORF Transcript_42003/g.55339 Transcript_42003/m.55339 type:complete len:94 (+) Transcript_42003:77-358(+)